jgi:CubicO group peptidase (beta-lactamase class C family)
MDSLFALIEKNQKGMGSISISKDGVEVYQHSFGYADFADSIRASADTKYRIGSISKTFTAAIILQLIDEGKLTTGTKLAEYFLGIQNSDKITVEEMLRHRSGLFYLTNASDYTSWMEQPKSRAEMLRIMAKNPSVFEPDSKAEYSNTNYVLLSYIAEKIDNKDFSEILKDRITKPLGLDNTYYGSKIAPEKNEALSYTYSNHWEPATETDMSIPAGAGAVISTPTDLNAFYYSLFNGKVVSDASLAKMKKLVDNFGMGMFQIPFYERKAFGHNGGIDGFRSTAGYFPDEKVSIAYTTNGMVMPMNDIMIGALSIYFGKDYSLPEFKEPLKIAPGQLDLYVGTYSSPGFPLKVTISRKDSTLVGQATGQPSFALEAYEPNKFKFDAAGLKLEFVPKENKMILLQGGGRFELTRE